MSNQLIYTGKAKDIYSTEDENVIKSVYKDQATMLNGARKETIKGKGVLNNQISSLIFEKLNAAGVADCWFFLKTFRCGRRSGLENSNC